MNACRPHVEIQKAKCVDSGITCSTEEINTDVQHLCHEDSNFVFSDVQDVNRKCDLEKIDHSDKKAKWNFTWKGKSKKAKVDNIAHDNDFDFETNRDLTSTGSELHSHQKAIASTKSKRTKKSRVGGSILKPSKTGLDTNLSSNVLDNTDAEYDIKTLHEISQGKNKETLDFPSLPPECNNRGRNDSKSIHVIESSCNENSCENLGRKSDNMALYNKITADDLCKSTSASKSQLSFTKERHSSLIESSYNVNDFENIEDDSKAINLGICDDLEAGESDESKRMIEDRGLCKTTDKTGLETPKKSYFDILMQNSEKNTDKTQIQGQENYGSKRSEKANECQMKYSSRYNEKTRNVNKTSRKKNHSGDSEDVGLTNSNESSMKKQNRGDSGIHQTETKEKKLRKSSRRKIKTNENEKMNTGCSAGEDRDECESSTRKSRAAARESGKTKSRKNETLEESPECSGEQLEKAGEIEHCERKEMDIVPLSPSQEENQVKGRKNNQSANGATDSEERENAVSTKQKSKSNRLR